MTAPSVLLLPSTGPQAPEKPALLYLHALRWAWGFVAAHWIEHLTLLLMGVLFIAPFVWMIGMSLETDDEATGTTSFPAVPVFRGDSPYVLKTPPVDRPSTAAADVWERVYPALISEAQSRIANMPLPRGALSGDGAALRHAGAIEAVRRGIARLNNDLWIDPHPDAQILRHFHESLADSDLSSSLQASLGYLELGGIEIRSLSGHVNAVGQEAPLWTVVSGNAQLIASGSGTQVLRYHFQSPSDPPVILRAQFDAAITAAQLHRMVVSYHGDASWHRIDAHLELGNRAYASDETTYLAQHRSASLLLQPPTFEDRTLSPRKWVPIKPIESAPISSPPTYARLTLILRPSSTARAIWGKVQRNYERAFRSVPFWSYVGNSLLLVVLQVGGALFSSGFVGYAFARLHWPGRSIALAILLATMMLPAQVTMIPSFLIWRALGWYNTLNPLWIGAWLGNAFFIFLMVQSMRAIPRELDEAARIDGMSALQTWWYVIMPQVKPTLAAIAIMTFIGAWNDFMGPLIMLRDQTKFPLSLGLFSMRLDAGTDWPLVMAGNLLMTLPVIVIFLLFQRYFIEGVTVTGIKG
jgi:multiple sugar transport system permease protein